MFGFSMPTIHRVRSVSAQCDVFSQFACLHLTFSGRGSGDDVETTAEMEVFFSADAIPFAQALATAINSVNIEPSVAQAAE